MSLSEQQKRFWLTPGNTIPCTLEVVNDAVNVIYELNTQITLSIEREERYRKALEEIVNKTKWGHEPEAGEDVINIHNVARQALEGEEK